MKIIKPLRMSLLQRPYRWQQKNYLGVAAITLLDMGQNPGLFTEQELWQTVPDELQSPDSTLDLAIPKACAEFLASGYAWTRHQPDKTRCHVTIQVGELRKQLTVTGDRVWQDNLPGDAQSFDSLPLDWQHAFGGSEFAENPLGFGAEHGNGKPLPNVEAPQRLLTETDQSPLPASFNALAYAMPRRQSLMGKNFDDNWLQNEYPGFALDTDWQVFNQAEQDQWFKDQPQLPSGAPWRIENMHPEIPVQQGNLPLWQARCFMTRNDRFEEILLRATTVHFFPHLNKMMLIWHGSALINEDDAADVDSLMIALEMADAPKDITHYQQVHHQRCNTEEAVLHAMQDGDLIADAILNRSKNMLGAPAFSPVQQNAIAGMQYQRDKFIASMAEKGHPLDDATIPTLPETKPEHLDHNNLHQIMRRKEQEGDAQFEQMLDQYHQHQNKTGSQIDDDQLPSGVENYRQQQASLSGTETMFGSSTEKVEKSRQALFDNYRLSAHRQNAPKRLLPEESQSIQRQLNDLMAAGGDKDASGSDFTGADLSGLDLRGVNFENALLENTDFSHCQLEGCNFSNAVLVRAEFHHSSAQGCLFDGANLSLTQCWHSDFTGSGFDETECEDAQFEHCIFDHSQLTDLFIRKAHIHHCRFRQAELGNCDFMDLQMSNLDFSGATLQSCNFIRCNLDAFSFSGITATGISLVSCKAAEINFCDAQMKQCMFVSDTLLQHACFRRAALSECNFRGQQLQRAIFDQARLENCDLSAANCQQASMQLMHTRDSRFVRTKLHFADLRGSLLLGADFQKSELQGCDMSDCNLFRADLSQTLTDESTRFEESVTDGMKTLPRRSEQRV